MILLATVRHLANMPCPQCFTPKAYICLLGTHQDTLRCQRLRMDNSFRQDRVETARRFIFEKGRPIASAGVEGILKDLSMVPTQVRDQFNINKISC
jgi:hypothetical protein